MPVFRNPVCAAAGEALYTRKQASKRRSPRSRLSRPRPINSRAQGCESAARSLQSRDEPLASEYNSWHEWSSLLPLARDKFLARGEGGGGIMQHSSLYRECIYITSQFAYTWCSLYNAPCHMCKSHTHTLVAGRRARLRSSLDVSTHTWFINIGGDKLRRNFFFLWFLRLYMSLMLVNSYWRKRKRKVQETNCLFYLFFKIILRKRRWCCSFYTKENVIGKF